MALPIDADQLMRSLSRSKVRSRASMDPEMLAAMKTLKNRVTELRQNPSPDQDLGSEFSWGGELSTARSSATTDDRRFTSTLAKIDGPAMTSRLSEGVIGRQTQEGSKCGADAGTMMAPWDLQGVQGRGGSIGKDYSKPWMVVGPAGEPAHGWTPGRNTVSKENNPQRHREWANLLSMGTAAGKED